jgi:hypothetical protein
MSEKYNMREVLQKLLNERPSADWVTIQAETFGAGFQKRDYGMKVKLKETTQACRQYRMGHLTHFNLIKIKEIVCFQFFFVSLQYDYLQVQVISN